jgi:hypothetical protein
MGMQPAEHGRTAPTQMLPMMPAIRDAKQVETKLPPAAKESRTRADALRAARARITRRKSLRKQRAAQKS